MSLKKTVLVALSMAIFGPASPSSARVLTIGADRLSPTDEQEFIYPNSSPATP
jgi:hypothetical protein